jgi:4-amino-4-deoxy-L-arabinose transferase-like glycosyltransferase
MRKSDLFPICLFLVSLLLASSSIINNSGKPFSMDEAYPFAWNAHQIIEKGVTALGERQSAAPDQTRLEIAHPPLYVLTLASVFKLFGESEKTGRLLGILCLGLTLLFLFNISGILNGSADRLPVWLITASMILINPYMIQHALLIDIDPTLLALAMTVVVYLYLKYDQTGKAGWLWGAGLALGITLWIKEMTPPVIPAAVFLYEALRHSWKRAFRTALLLLATGLLFFIGTWGLFCLATGVPPLVFMRFLLAGKGFWFTVFTHYHSVIYVLKAVIIWLSFPLWILFILELFRRIPIKSGSRGRGPVDFIFIYAALMMLYTLVYIPLSTGLMLVKYAYPAFPVLFLAVAARIHPEARNKAWIAWTAAAILIPVYYHFFRLGDPFLQLYENRLPFTGKLMLVYLAPFVLLTALPKIRRLRTPWKDCLLAAAVLAYWPMNAAVLQKQATAPYCTSPSWYNYGEKGLKETIAHLASHLEPGDEVVARKDIGYYLNKRCGFETLRWHYPLFRGDRLQGLAEFQGIYPARRIRYIVLDRLSTGDYAKEIIRPHFDLDIGFGDFYIYRSAKREP